jgi:hypothetical protein
MATKKHSIIIIIVSAAIAVIISFIQWKRHNRIPVKSNVFRLANGWGYDILVNDQLIIHQETIPAIPSKQPFVKKEHAERAAQLVIDKLRLGNPPTLTQPDLEKILPAHELKNEQQRKHQ